MKTTKRLLVSVARSSRVAVRSVASMATRELIVEAMAQMEESFPIELIGMEEAPASRGSAFIARRLGTERTNARNGRRIKRPVIVHISLVNLPFHA